MATTPWAGSGTATTTAATIDLTKPITGNPVGQLTLRNTDGANKLLVSFDGGTTFAPTLLHGESLSVSGVLMTQVQVKSDTATTAYEWVAVDPTGR